MKRVGTERYHDKQVNVYQLDIDLPDTDVYRVFDPYYKRYEYTVVFCGRNVAIEYTRKEALKTARRVSQFA